MTDELSLWSPLNRRTLLGLLALIALAVLASSTTFGNRFSQDDLAIILKDEGMHAFSLSRIFLEPYWPAPFFRDLYRPFASSLFAAEWWMGGGSAYTYRIISVTIYVLGTLACFTLARRLLSAPFAWAVAALFAVHPVHVEAVAVAVNQGELVVAVMLAFVTAWYIDLRRQGATLGWRESGIIALAMLAGGLVKEHAVVLPGLICLVELLMFRDPPTFLARLVAARRTLLLCVLSFMLLILPRALIFKGDLKGSFTAEGLLDLNMFERFLTMLQVVPRWIYLIIWPAHLQADYSPHVIMAARSFGVEQFGGLVLLALLVWVGLRTRRDQPAIFFGLAFAGITILPVSNVLFPTGIMLAERTLYAPSLGALIAIGGVAQAFGHRLPARPLYRQLGWGLVEVLLALGLYKSIARHQAWHDPYTLAMQTVQDAPLSYRAWFGLGNVYLDLGRPEEGRKMLVTAIDLSPGSTPLYFTMGDSYRTTDECDKAIPYYERGLAGHPYDLPRAGLIACLVWLGQYEKAHDQAMKGMRDGEDGKLFQTWLRLADSGRRISAPPKTIHYPVDAITSAAGQRP